jgi:hypothetical protein
VDYTANGYIFILPYLIIDLCVFVLDAVISLLLFLE